MNKDVQRLVKHLRGQGLDVDLAGSGHYIVRDDGKKVYALPHTPSDRRWLLNAVSDLKRLGLMNRGEQKKSSGGQSPPPLPVIPRREDVMPYEKGHSGGGRRKLFPMTTIEKISVNDTFDEVAKQFNLKVRAGKSTAHGSSSVLANVMNAYELETGDKVPNFNYTAKDQDDRMTMATLAGKRLSDYAAKYAVGDQITTVGQATIAYMNTAWRWFKELNYKFPDGRVIFMKGTGLKVVWPVPVDDPVATITVPETPFWQDVVEQVGQTLRPGSTPQPAPTFPPEEYLPLAPAASSLIEDPNAIDPDELVDKARDRVRKAAAVSAAATNGTVTSPLAIRIAWLAGSAGMSQDEAIDLAQEVDAR